MSEWKAKRFWKSARIEAAEGGHTVLLDTRPVRTPGKQALILPTEAMAEAVAAEWDAQQEVINPLTMPVTRAANSAIEKVTPQRDGVIEMLAEYGDTDLLCYRATDPEGLVARQQESWDPLLDWAHDAFGARLLPVAGVIHQPQPPEALTRLRTALTDFDAFALTGVHDLIMLSGSMVLGLAVTRDAIDPEAAWELSRIDEQWQIEQWGHDDEAAQMAAAKRQGFLDAARFYRLSLP